MGSQSETSRTTVPRGSAPPPTKGPSNASDAAVIRGMMDEWAAGVRAKDAERVVRLYAADAVTFDLAPPLKSSVKREDLEAWFATWRGPIECELTDVSITVDAGLAFARCINRIAGTKTDGEETSVWVRATVCFRKAAGQWKVIHEHVSVPFYMDGSLKAAVDLEP